MKKFTAITALFLAFIFLVGFGSSYIYRMGDKVSIGQYSNDFDNAITKIGSSKRMLVIDTNIVVTEDVTVPSTCALEINRNGSLTYQDANVDLTINGPVQAGPYQWLDPNRDWVTFGSSAVKEIYSEWWGSNQIQAALDCIYSSGGGFILSLLDKTYTVSLQSAVGNYNYALLIKSSNTKIQGIPGETVIQLDANQDCTVMRTAWTAQDSIPASGRLHDIVIKDLTINGDWDNQHWAGPDGNGVYDQNGLGIYAADDVILDNVYVKNCAQDGLVCSSSSDITIDRCRVENCGKNNLALFLAHNVNVNGVKVTNANSSPDPNSKDYYTLSSDGYAGIDCAYPPAATQHSEQINNININSPEINQANGRGISIIENANTVKIVEPKINMNCARHGISLAYTDTNYASAISINSGYIYNYNTSTSRLISATNVSELSIIDTQGYKSTALGSFVFVDCNKVSVIGCRVKHGGASGSATIDIRGSGIIELIGNHLIDGTISFNTSVTNTATVIGNIVESGIVGWSTITNKLIFGNRGDTYSRDMTTRTAAPTLGTWAIGDMIFNLQPTQGENAGWICTVAGDPNDFTFEMWGQVGNRTSTDSPIDSLSPKFLGEELLDTNHNIWYKSYSASDANCWAALN